MSDQPKSIWQKKPNVLGEAIKIHWRIPEWFPEYSPERLQQLKIYYDELMKVNNAVNLIGVKTIPMADAIHFADSILASHLIAKDRSIDTIHDFGSGNGFPGMIFALLYPNIKVVLVDSDERKSEFLKHVASRLSIQNIQVLTTQVERLPEKSVKFGMSRGLGNIAKMLLMTRRCFAKDGVLYHLKGEEWFKEVAEIPTQLCSFWKASLVSEYRLPVGEIKFAVVRTEKFAE